MFEKTLQDLVKGIRNHKKNEAEYIASQIAEIRDEELRNNDIKKKYLAVQKLTYVEFPFLSIISLSLSFFWLHSMC